MFRTLPAAIVVCLAIGCEKDGADGVASAGKVKAHDLIPAPSVTVRPRRPAVSADLPVSTAGFAQQDEDAALSSVCEAMLSGDAEARRKALVELADVRARTDDDDDEATRQTIVVMTAGLTDSDESVRDAAFATLLRLPAADRRALSLQALGNADVDIKLALLQFSREPCDEFEFTFNFQALDAAEPEVRKAASRNLKELIGRTFPSSEAAFDWWETAPEAQELATSWQDGK